MILIEGTLLSKTIFLHFVLESILYPVNYEVETRLLCIEINFLLRFEVESFQLSSSCQANSNDQYERYPLVPTAILKQYPSINMSYLTDSYIGFTLKMESVSKNTIFDLKMMVKSGLEKIFLKFLHAGDYFPMEGFQNNFF